MAGGMRTQALVIGGLGIAVTLTTIWRLLPHGNVEASPAVFTSAAEQLTVFDRSDVGEPPTKLNDSQPTASAKALLLIDVASGYPLYEKNADQAVPIASTTKLMTAVVALEHLGLNDVVTVPARAVSVDGSKIQLRTGEEITVESLLKGLLIQSGNDTANALADHVGYEAFMSAMNEKARELGMTGTRFMDPAGLDDTGHSTARDLGILGAYALRHDVIRGIVRLTEASVYSSDGRIEHRLQTSNRLIKSDHPLFMPDVTGLKTGFTYEAGHCLVASASQNGHTLVSVVLGTTEDTAEASAKESRKLLSWAFTNFSWK